MPSTLRRAWPFALWLGAAAVASGIGLGAVRLVGADAGPSSTPAGPVEVPAVAVAASSGPPASTKTTATKGGTVYATCAGAGAHPVVQAVPSAGWQAVAPGAAYGAELHQLVGGDVVRVAVRCTPSGPVLTVDAAVATSPTVHATVAVPTATGHGPVEPTEGEPTAFPTGFPTAFPTSHGMTAPTSGSGHGGFPSGEPTFPMGEPSGSHDDGFGSEPPGGGFGRG